jgi:DHA1 family inner membrane transport protein
MVMALALLGAIAVLGAGGDTIPLPAVIATMMIWGVAFGGILPLLQTRMMHAASLRVRDVAASWTTISFNFSIGAGAFIGGVLLDRFGIAVLPWAEFAVMSAGVVFVIVTDSTESGVIRMATHPRALLPDDAPMVHIGRTPPFGQHQR